MLSRLIRKSVLSSRSSPIVTSQRFLASSIPETERAEYCIKIETTEIAEDTDPSKVVVTEMDNYTPKPAPYYGPQRDYKNFPTMVQLEEPVKSRLCMFPESWFKFLYPKLGVTGPYTLGAGFILFLINKELYLIDDVEFRHTCAFFAWVYIFVRTPLGGMVRDLIWSKESGTDEALINLHKYNKEIRTDAIAHEKQEQWRLEGKNLLFQAKKENVGLQLEAAYRQSFMNTYHQLKRQLDYQVEVTKIDQRIKQQFMVKWVLNRVNESIGQASEKENLKQCIANLNALAARV